MGSKLVLMDCGKALDPWIVVTRTSCWSVIILFTPGFLFPDTPTVTSSVTTGVVISNRLISAQLLQIAAIRVWPSIPMVTDPSAHGWWVSVCVSSHWLWLRFSFYLVLWLTSNHVKFNSALMVWRGRQFLSNLINLKSETYWLLSGNCEAITAHVNSLITLQVRKRLTVCIGYFYRLLGAKIKCNLRSSAWTIY